MKVVENEEKRKIDSEVFLRELSAPSALSAVKSFSQTVNERYGKREEREVSSEDFLRELGVPSALSAVKSFSQPVNERYGKREENRG